MKQTEQMLVDTLGGLGGGVLTGGVGAVQGVVATCTYLFSVTGAGAAMKHGSQGATEQSMGGASGTTSAMGESSIIFLQSAYFAEVQ